MTMHVNIPTVHTLSDSNTKETKGRCRQAGTDSLCNKKDPSIKPTIKVQHGNLRSDSTARQGNIHPRIKEPPIRVCRLSHEAGISRNDPPKKGKRTIVIKIANLYRHDPYREASKTTDPQQTGNHAPPGNPELEANRQQADGHTPAGKPVLETKLQRGVVILRDRKHRDSLPSYCHYDKLLLFRGGDIDEKGILRNILY